MTWHWGTTATLALYRPAEEGGPGVKQHDFRFWGVRGHGWRFGLQWEATS